ncbi:MAG: PQQ-binding-like beta-propeller repeat protein [Opitutaceae bacterium]
MNLSVCHCEGDKADRGNPARISDGLLRRYAPRNDKLTAFHSVSRGVPRLLLTATLLAFCAGEARAAETGVAKWPQFRGENASGVGAADARPPIKFSPNEAVLWKVEVPWSPSSPSVWGERIFLTTFENGQLETRCYERTNGALRWTRGVKPTGVELFHQLEGSPAASTPATDGAHVVSYFGSFGLICHDMNGKELWRYPLSVAETMGDYGSGTSPVIAGDRVLLNRDQHQFSSLLAVDLKTGAKIWEASRADVAGSFGTPTLWRNNGVDEVVLGGSARLRGYDLATGAERWVVEGITRYVCTTAIVGDGVLFYGGWSSGQADAPFARWDNFLKAYNKNGDNVVDFSETPPEKRDSLRGLDKNRDGKLTEEDFDLLKASDIRADNVMMAIKPGGTGDITETHVAWKFRRALPYVPSPLFYDGRIYFVKDGGVLSSLDAKTGEPFYAQTSIDAAGNYFASPVAANGRIYLASSLGKITVVKAGGNQPEILHQTDFAQRVHATPVLVGDNLYLRTATHLWAFGKR